jgi:hypothetical protein
MKKVIFLDFDGVLNNIKSLKMNIDLIPEKILMIKELVDHSGADIVISSSWRLWHTQDQIKNLLAKNTEWDADDIPIIGFTPVTDDEEICRGNQIQSYIDDNNVKNYVIIDDRDDMLEHQFPSFVNTNEKFGITFTDLKKAKRILGGK